MFSTQNSSYTMELLYFQRLRPLLSELSFEREINTGEWSADITGNTIDVVEKFLTAIRNENIV